jgi:ribulose-phosphate 3-epimerase
MGWLAPSILAADILRLQEQLQIVAEEGADYIHVDVMDGHFVPNLTFGPIMAQAVSRATSVPVDVHLMISNPMNYLARYAEAGSAIITVHHEACLHLDRALNEIKSLNCRAGVSINPATPVSAIEPVLEIADLVLVMSVNPGFGGQKFIPYTLDKIRRLYELRKERHLDYLIEVDGGVDPITAKEALLAGVDILVAGVSVFRQPSIRQACRELKEMTGKICREI